MPTYFQMDFSCSMSLQNTWTTLQRESRLSALLGTQSACIFPIHKSKQWASFCYIPRKKHFWKLKSHFKENHEYAHNTTLIYPILLCIFNLSCALHFLAYQLYAYYKVSGGGFFCYCSHFYTTNPKLPAWQMGGHGEVTSGCCKRLKWGTAICRLNQPLLSVFNSSERIQCDY